jgi:acid-sensing ion channel, other
MEKREAYCIERCWRFITFLISVVFCTVFVVITYTKWRNNPLIIEFAADSTQIWDIPFPAVTICPETKTKVQFVNITDVYRQLRQNKDLIYNMGGGKRDRLTALSQVCDPEIFEMMDPQSQISCKDCTETLRNIGVKKTEVLTECQFQKHYEKCDDMFEELITEEGICYAFNSFENYRKFSFRGGQKSSSWNVDDGYGPRVIPDTIPRKAMGSGTRFGLFVMLTLEKLNYDYVCKGPVQGFKLYLHMPNEVPQITKHFYRIPMEQEMIIVIKPKIMSTSMELKHHSISKRQCYFSNERELKYFQQYTQSNCEMECLANFTIAQCGCVRFNFPTFSNDVEICGASKISCLRKAEFELLQLQISQGLKEQEMQCNCLPGCNSITYDVEISQSDFNMTAYMEARRLPTSNMEG